MPRYNPYRWPFKWQSRFVYDKKEQFAYKPLVIKNDKIFLNFLRYLKNSSFISYLTTIKLAKIIEKQWLKRDRDKIWRQYELFVWTYKIEWIIFWIIFFWYVSAFIKTLWYIMCLCNEIWVTQFEPWIVKPIIEYLITVQWGINLLCFICVGIFCFNIYLFYKVSTGIYPWYFRYIFIHSITLYYIFYIFSYF
jgi:hypothetical protein